MSLEARGNEVDQLLFVQGLDAVAAVLGLCGLLADVDVVGRNRERSLPSALVRVIGLGDAVGLQDCLAKESRGVAELIDLAVRNRVLRGQ